MNKTAILCVDDESIVTGALRDFFSNNLPSNQIVEIAHSAEETFEVIDELKEDGIELQVIIADYYMPKVRGDELLIEVHRKLPQAKKIMLTGQSDVPGIKRAINEADLYRFIEKPWDNDDLLLTVKGAIHAYNNERTLELQNESLKKLNEELELKVAERTKKLEIQAITDPLTGIHNRLKLDQEFKTELERAMRYKTPFSTIMLDLDKFKNVNDTYGHQVGDQTLKETAKILVENCRKVDIVGRWGGEEFLILCPETDLSGANNSANNLREIIEKKNFPVIEKITASFGVSSYRDGDDLQSVLGRADQALYQAKEKGRNRVESS